MIVFNVVVTFFSADRGGRSKPPASGYRPPIWFGQVDSAGQPVTWDFEFEFRENGPTSPVRFGEDVPAVMRSVVATINDVPLEGGTTFQVREGARLVGRGRVTGVVPK